MYNEDMKRKKPGRRKNDSLEPHYYSERLRRKLNELRFASAAIVEAPSGYGKTTAVRDFLENQHTSVYWFSAMDEAPEAGFRRLCYEIDKIDSISGERLLKTGLPNVATIGETCDALRTIQCRQDTYLVIDNFQLMQTALMPSFFCALLDHGGERLHIVIITQMLGRDFHMAAAGRGYLHIAAHDLRLEAQDIRSYFALADLNLSPEDAQNVAYTTEGWMVAVYLQLHTYRETGAFSDTTVLSLMEHLVWDALGEEQQHFLVRLSPFETITIQQACGLMGCETLPGSTREALQSPFIHYDRARQRYELHSLLTELLEQKRKERGVAFERECLLCAGNLCCDEGRISEALDYYWRIKDYEHILSLDFSQLILSDIGKTPFSEIAMDLVKYCPTGIQKANLLSMLRIAWALLTYGFSAAFSELMENLRVMIDSTDRDEISNLRGEWMLLLSFHHYPRLDEMISLLDQADAFFKGTCSQVISSSSLWWFGSCIPLADFHMIPGEADGEGERFETYIALLSKLTGGYGSGADALYHAVLAYHRGNVNEAETLAYKAAYLAENKKQSMIQLGVALQLAQAALHKADTENWQHAVHSMERSASCPLQNTYVVRSVLDIMRGMLFIELQQLDGIADWLKNGEFSEKKLLPQMLPLALFIHGLYLLHQGEPARLIGMIEAELSKSSMIPPVYEMLLTLNLAAGHFSAGNQEQAAALLLRISKKVLPDGLFFPFASFSWLLGGLTDHMIAQEYPGLLSKFKETKERFGSGWTKLYQDISPEELPLDLTEREREVALLAAGGLRNSEIAEKLFVSESTVRTHMRTIFRKLDIDRRIKLAEKLKNQYQ